MKEFTPVFTERATNILASEFKEAMQAISASLKEIYHAHSVIILPGSGTFAMEAATRQFAANKKVLVLCNGFFGDRWNKILLQGNIASHTEVMKAEKRDGKYHPSNITKILQKIEDYQPQVIFLTHVETSTGIMLPDEYIKTIAKKAHHHNAVIIVDAIASGSCWLDMEELNIDILVTAPQKGLSAQAGCGILLLNETAKTKIKESKSTSLSLDLGEWMRVMDWFEGGEFAYHATLPTNALLSLRDSLHEIKSYGFAETKKAQGELGRAVRGFLEKKGYPSVAAEDFQSSSVLVHFAGNPAEIVQQCKENQLRIGGALPFMLENTEKPNTFRIGLLGIEKIKAKEQTVDLLKEIFQRF